MRSEGRVRPALDVHSRRPHPPHQLPLRPAGEAVAADHPAAAGAPLPDVDPRLLAAHRARDAFPELAAGSARQLPGAGGVPRRDAIAGGHGRSRRRDRGHQPVRLLRRARGRGVAVQLRAGAVPRPRPVQDTGPARSAPARPHCVDSPAQDAHPRLPRRPQPAPRRRHRLHHPHGAGRPAARRDAGEADAARVATPAGCSWSCCATSGSPRASSPAT